MSVKHSVLDLTSFKRCVQLLKFEQIFQLCLPHPFVSYCLSVNCSRDFFYLRCGQEDPVAGVLCERREKRPINTRRCRSGSFWVGGYVRSREGVQQEFPIFVLFSISFFFSPFIFFLAPSKTPDG